jgi:uncharacterized protein YbjT (DUF2867 family)
MDRLDLSPLNGGMTNTNTILVIGSTGKTGKRVTARLVELGHDVRHGSRSSATPFDWERPDTWAPALAGVTAAYVAYSPDLAAPGSCEAITELTRLASAAGLERLVLLSGRGEEEAQRAESVLRNSGLKWTIVRATWFAQNFSEGNFVDDVVAGVVALPVGDVLEPFVDADDIADVAVAALTDDRHVGQTYELTGPRLLTFADAVAEISSATARVVEFQTVSMDDYAAVLADYQVPPGEVDLLRYLFTTVLDGRNSSLTDGVQRALGREPKDFRDFARDAAAAGAWVNSARE